MRQTTYRVVRPSSAPIRDQEHHATPKPPPAAGPDGFTAQLAFRAWDRARLSGDRLQAAKHLAELRALVERTRRKV